VSQDVQGESNARCSRDAPLLHDELLARRLRLLHVRLQRARGQVPGAVGVDRDHVQRRAVQPRRLHRLFQPRLAARQDKDLRASLVHALEVGRRLDALRCSSRGQT
jgi:hypothetical protein